MSTKKGGKRPQQEQGGQSKRHKAVEPDPEPEPEVESSADAYDEDATQYMDGAGDDTQYDNGVEATNGDEQVESVVQTEEQQEAEESPPDIDALLAPATEDVDLDLDAINSANEMRAKYDPVQQAEAIKAELEHTPSRRAAIQNFELRAAFLSESKISYLRRLHWAFFMPLNRSDDEYARFRQRFLYTRNAPTVPNYEWDISIQRIVPGGKPRKLDGYRLEPTVMSAIRLHGTGVPNKKSPEKLEKRAYQVVLDTSRETSATLGVKPFRSPIQCQRALVNFFYFCIRCIWEDEIWIDEKHKLKAKLFGEIMRNFKQYGFTCVMEDDGPAFYDSNGEKLGEEHPMVVSMARDEFIGGFFTPMRSLMEGETPVDTWFSNTAQRMKFKHRVFKLEDSVRVATNGAGDVSKMTRQHEIKDMKKDDEIFEQAKLAGFIYEKPVLHDAASGQRVERDFLDPKRQDLMVEQMIGDGSIGAPTVFFSIYTMKGEEGKQKRGIKGSFSEIQLWSTATIEKKEEPVAVPGVKPLTFMCDKPVSAPVNGVLQIGYGVQNQAPSTVAN